MTAKQIINETEIGNLFQEKIEIGQRIAQAYLDKKDPNKDYEKAIAEIRTQNILSEMIDTRLDQLRNLEKTNADEDMRVKHNFIRIAKKLLTKDTFNKIYTLSKESLREIKPFLNEHQKVNE